MDLILHCCGVGRRWGSDPVLLWLWQRAVAVAPIQPVAWEPLDAVSMALKSKKKRKKNCLIEVQLNYNVMLISPEQQSDLAIHVCSCPYSCPWWFVTGY